MQLSTTERAEYAALRRRAYGPERADFTAADADRLAHLREKAATSAIPLSRAARPDGFDSLPSLAATSRRGQAPALAIAPDEAGIVSGMPLMDTPSDADDTAQVVMSSDSHARFPAWLRWPWVIGGFLTGATVVIAGNGLLAPQRSEALMYLSPLNPTMTVAAFSTNYPDAMQFDLGTHAVVAGTDKNGLTCLTLSSKKGSASAGNGELVTECVRAPLRASMLTGPTFFVDPASSETMLGLPETAVVQLVLEGDRLAVYGADTRGAS